MNKGTIQVICGFGSGKTSAAIGMGLHAIMKQNTVIAIQFLKGNQETSAYDVLKRLEPDMKVFRFEKADTFFEHLSGEAKEEELVNIHNGLNFTKKVLSTGECSLLILDEILGILDRGIITVDEFREVLEAKEDEMDVILTGQVFPPELEPYVDIITKIENVKVDNSL